MDSEDAWGLAAWGTYLRAAGRPESTIALRVYHLRRLADRYPEPETVELEDLVTWLGGQAWSPNTRRAYRGSLRAYWAWATAIGRLEHSPAALLPPVTVPRARPRPAPETAYRLALMSADPRASLAIRLAAQCGLRRGEIATVRAEHVEQDIAGSWVLRVAGKGGHVRLVPLEEGLAAALRERGPGWVFPSSHGGHLTPHHLGKLVSRHLPDGLTTHTLRHRCATVAYAQTRDLRAVQELLGHAKPETTAIYTAVPNGAVREAMRAAAA